MFFSNVVGVEDYPDFRKHAYGSREEDVSAKPLKLTLRDLSDPQRGRFDVAVQDTNFECFLTPGSENKLFVFLSAGGRGGRSDTKFERHTWHRWTPATSLNIEDPMYKRHPAVKEGWYFGSEHFSHIEGAASIVRAVAEARGVQAQNIYFLGSSAGGTGALALADNIKGSTAIAMNPQLFLGNWRPSAEFLAATGLDLTDPRLQARATLERIKQNTDSRFYITFNAACEDDFERQLKPMLPGRQFQIGLNDLGNIKLIIGRYNYHKPHNIFFSAHEVSMMVCIGESDLPAAVKQNLMNNLVEEVNSKHSQSEKAHYLALWEEVSRSLAWTLQVQPHASPRVRTYQLKADRDWIVLRLDLNGEGLRRMRVVLEISRSAAAPSAWTLADHVQARLGMKRQETGSIVSLAGSYELAEGVSAAKAIAVLVEAGL